MKDNQHISQNSKAYVKLSTLSLIAAVLIMLSCAHVEAPSGGPEDKIPPQIAGIYPAPKSLNNPLKLNVHFQFTEWISSNISRTAIRISPPLEHGLTREINRDYLQISSRSTLDSNTTYTLVLSNQVQDLRGNGLRSPYTLIFSTGDKIDTLGVGGFISTNVRTSEVNTPATIALYPIGENRAKLKYLQFYKTDTTDIPLEPNLLLEKPYYLTSPDSSGTFSFSGLKKGSYQVIAFNDENGNSMPDAEYEPIALGESIVNIDTLNRDIFLSLDWMDSTLLQLNEIKAVGENRVELNFNRPPNDSLLYDSLNFQLWLNDSLIAYPKLTYINHKTKQPILQFEQLLSNKDYTIKAFNLSDSLGRKLDSTRSSASFLWKTQAADSLNPIRISYTEPVRNYKYLRPQDSIFLYFNRPMDLKNWQDRFLLLFKTDTLEHELKQIDLTKIAIYPQEQFTQDAQIILKYSKPDTTISIRKDSLKQNVLDSNSNIIKDTVIKPNYQSVANFETISRLKIGSLSGSVLNANEKTKGKLIALDEGITIEVSFDNTGNFKLDSLIEGNYLFEYYHDLNNNNLRDLGKLHPFEHAEAFRAVPDTLKIKRNHNQLDSLSDYIPPLY